MSESHHKLQANRFELKYIVNEQRASDIRRYSLPYLQPDKNMARAPSGVYPGYPIHSLYLDSDSMLLYRQTSEGKKDRFKLRVRFYDAIPSNPAFLEVKRRCNDTILKERTAVKRGSVDRILQGSEVSEEDLYNLKSVQKDLVTLRRFVDLVRAVGAQPSTYVSYYREAYMGIENDQVRLTMDRSVGASEFDWNLGLDTPRECESTDLDGVVLELKFTDRFPDWMHDMVLAFDLERCSVPKYLLCIDRLGRAPDKFNSNLGVSFDAWDESQIMSIFGEGTQG
jgi:SPX domain protein involved in polyphosphate accumulation